MQCYCGRPEANHVLVIWRNCPVTAWEPCEGTGWLWPVDVSTGGRAERGGRASCPHNLGAALQTVVLPRCSWEDTGSCVWVAVKGLLCCLALYCERPADGVVPGPGGSMNAKIFLHKEGLLDEDLWRVEFFLLKSHVLTYRCANARADITGAQYIPMMQLPVSVAFIWANKLINILPLALAS